MRTKSERGRRGFTLIEMVIVISMILVLLSIALPMYNKAILRSKEAKLHQNLVVLNQAIQNYGLDKKHAPQSLDDLVPAYVKFIPDDITGSNTWVTEQEDPQDAYDPNQTGIGWVHSSSKEMSSEGTEYSTWTH
ncbi:MAG: type II secretion system GspH family protein [Acidobacteriia bacterium]|nr:type II secretion system GspH family protein [Terriglobia bacterium]